MTKQPSSDLELLERIQKLVQDEHALHERGTLDPKDHQRLEGVRVELDQCWDLLRQRRALREFGDDPGKARVRPRSVVEKYEQ